MKTIKGLTTDSTLAEAARRSLGQRAREVKRALRRAANGWSDDPEVVHDLRVATRRAEAAFELYAACLPRKAARRWRKRLASIRHSASAARDADVQWAYFQSLPPTDPIQAIRRRLVDRRQSAQGPIRRERAKWSTAKWRRRRRRLGLANSRHFKVPANWRVWSRAQLDRLASEFVAAAAAPSASDDALHQFRIAAKRLRYGLELLLPAAPWRDRKLVYHELTAVQDVLGELRDAMLRITFVKQILEGTDGNRPTAQSAGLLRHLENDLTARRGAYHAFWEKRGRPLVATVANKLTPRVGRQGSPRDAKS